MNVYKDENCKRAIQLDETVSYDDILKNASPDGVIFYKNRHGECNALVAHNNMLQFEHEDFLVGYKCVTSTDELSKCFRNKINLKSSKQ